MKEIEEIMEEDNFYCIKADARMMKKIKKDIDASNFFKEIVHIASQVKGNYFYLEFRYSPLDKTLSCGLFNIGDGTMDTDPQNALDSLYIKEVNINKEQLGRLLYTYLHTTRKAYPKFLYNAELFYYHGQMDPSCLIGHNGSLVQTQDETLPGDIDNQIVARTGVKVCLK